MELRDDESGRYAWGSDDWLMGIALRVARFGLGTTAPNPSVGAVLYRPDLECIVGRGVTQAGGRPHAEPAAIDAAGDLARGATMAVTLEPCSHFGRSPPCVDAILAAGVSRVIHGAVDPDPRVAGRGLRVLREAGVEIVAANRVHQAEARWITRGHILRVTERRPWVQVKIAVDAGGHVKAGGDGAPTWVTGPLARAQGHMMRAMADAICVGTGTVLADDPDLTCRLPGLAHRSPLRVVIGDRPVPETAKLARLSPGAPAVVRFTARDGDPPAATCGIDVRAVSRVGGRIWLPEVLEALAADGVTRLLVEGGPALWNAFAAARLVDEIVIFHARPNGSDWTSEQQSEAVIARYCPARDLKCVMHRGVGDDDMWVFRTREAVGWRRTETGE
jgi:diaminohydroxyphosphoribosylaminopyrimidine deaminase/5-amino-6-(5-phosphoribosylamino)uracil reductase